MTSSEHRRHRMGMAMSDKIALACMLSLTFTTGIADAVGYLALDKVFTGNMTGNVVILGMGAAGAESVPVTGPLVALIAFMTGAALGGRLMRHQCSGWSTRAAMLFFAVGGAFGIGAVLFAVADVRQGTVLAYAMTALLAAAMGLQAATARKVAVKDVTTVVVTSTITGLAADSVLGAHTTQPWVRRAGAIVLIGAGAVVGALLLKVAPWLSVAVPAALTIAIALFGEITTRRLTAAQ